MSKIMEKSANGGWSLVHPTPGICIKFRDVTFPESLISRSNSSKFFINLAHCIELPQPNLDLDEDEAVKILENDPKGVEIPIHLGELDTTEDRNGEPVVKIDVIVNSDFFRKRICESEFYRHFTIRTACECIEAKCKIHLDMKKQSILRNKKCIGDLRKEFIKPMLCPVTEKGQVKEGKEIIATVGEKSAMDIDDIEDQPVNSVRNYKVQVVNGDSLDLRIKVKDRSGNMVAEPGRLSLKMNDDRIVLIVDGQHTVADLFIPFKVDDKDAKCTFNPETSCARVRCPVDWS